ncbi:MAG: hypothetical protein JRH15_09655 [Deltaproteobacteria bacterium]|nr:hypothetical protein [Deltaproteobacteria bacterium]
MFAVTDIYVDSHLIFLHFRQLVTQPAVLNYFKIGGFVFKTPKRITWHGDFQGSGFNCFLGQRIIDKLISKKQQKAAEH